MLNTCHVRIRGPSGGISMSRKFTPIPDIDLDEIDEDIRRNREERLKFVKFYAEWVRDHSSAVVFRQQKEIIHEQLR